MEAARRCEKLGQCSVFAAFFNDQQVAANVAEKHI